MGTNVKLYQIIDLFRHFKWHFDCSSNQTVMLISKYFYLFLAYIVQKKKCTEYIFTVFLIFFLVLGYYFLLHFKPLTHCIFHSITFPFMAFGILFQDPSTPVTSLLISIQPTFAVGISGKIKTTPFCKLKRCLWFSVFLFV